MDKSRGLNFFELCRLCLNEHGTVDVFHTNHLAEEIFLLTTITISTMDKLPQKVCQKCVDVIQDANKLRNLALRNESNLQCLFGDESRDEITDELNQIKSHIVNNFNENESTVEKVNNKKDKRKNENNSTNHQQTLPDKNTSCNKTKSETHLKSKRRRDSDNEDVLYVCGDCNKNFETWKKLYHHQRSHTKSMACPLEACGKAFATKGDLEKHKRTHTGEKPYQCEICEKCYTQRVTLKVHKETVHGVQATAATSRDHPKPASGQGTTKLGAKLKNT